MVGLFVARLCTDRAIIGLIDILRDEILGLACDNASSVAFPKTTWFVRKKRVAEQDERPSS
jgi:hypothetical protein